jgi:hypothetical protein
MPKSSPRRNAAEARIHRFLKGFTAKRAGRIIDRAVAGAGHAVGLDPKYKNPPNPIRIERAR